MTAPASSDAFDAWLEANADALDVDPSRAADILPQLVRSRTVAVGVPEVMGGTGGTIADAIDTVAAVAQRSLTAAFVLWGHRTFVEYVLQSDNDALRARWLTPLLDGEVAGATGLSNAMKYLSDIEPLQMHAARSGNAFVLNGSLPWITNLRREGFIAAAAFDHDDGTPPSVFAIPHDARGVERSDDLDLIGLRASNTAALRVSDTVLDESYRLAADAPAWLARVRPAFLGLQCGMSIGLARRALLATLDASEPSRASIGAEIRELETTLADQAAQLKRGVLDGTFLHAPAAMFELRIALVETVSQAVSLEVQATGGRGYLRGQSGSARRVREASFIPIVTPSLVQLKSQLARHRRAAAA
ncbi:MULTISPECIES: acyl-CoA dehydrogenase family protein [Burkholderia]|uniref:acyl-CoA dehydrogenase family protein n=1 Tax=Burkholderia TaxID=32008 RepID=UPI00158CD4F2|nr:acyl-CoA dehydrogenase family protein [Burkholderia cepacia]MCA8056773.1 acyl-CoA/acyl-ACP dehydrogenase [Burkholderia cepacia]MCA8134448.1 acyl-CoA/acyl-ACP dehydrogenase [Burkholderia cepacia]MCA8158564.1 acyl-CoA/acyl-ACP dehydrogenase [Burkholderia cepacia]HEM7889753.1 acyl-CoA/acyl-ACP dehydrogenase [Burkholderia cepacia]HEM8510481.1 acyl-CoA/acyl-ACP dehydrogenase [Burkholderia cepacia]